MSCGSSEFSTRTKLPVCDGCRAALVKYPFPRWVKLAAFLVCAIVIVSLSVSRERVADSLHLLRAEKMAKAEKWNDAYQGYHDLAEKHRGNMDVMLAYAEAAVHSGHHEDAFNVLRSLSGRRATDRQMWRADMVSAELERTGHGRPLSSSSAMPFNVN